MSLLSLNGVSLAYGLHPLLDQVDLSIDAGERVCLVGRNGSGKSTLLRVITGVAQPDDGVVWRRDTLRISHLEQEVPSDSADTVYDVVASGLGELGGLLAEYHSLAARLAASEDDDALQRLSTLQQRIEALDGWTVDNRIATALTRLSLPADRLIAECSGGLRRRAMLARALVSDPDLLLLDEPTNHMDIEAIGWLEEYLLGFRGALIFITHDRTLARRLATRIIELDRGRLTSWPGNYELFLRRRDEMLEAESKAQAHFDRQLAEHEVWIRQGIKARRTRNEGRVRRLLAMRRERAQRLERTGTAHFGVDSGEASGRRVVDLRNVSFRYGDRMIIRDLSTTIMRGDRVGIVGPNGSGKSTLLRLILGDLEPQSGEVVHGSRLQLAYFDQHREQLDPERTVRENISDGSDYVNVRGRSRHVAGYLKDFLFPPARLDSPVRILSGGERNRLLLARIFTRPANMMVLDEPTNDLDIETLELLEDLLADYDGTLLLVSHDRSFLDQVVTSMLVFEGDGQVGEYVGGYEDWLRQRAERPATPSRARPASAPPAAPAPNRGNRLAYRERQELDALPARIESMENELAGWEEKAGRSDFYQRESGEITADVARMDELRAAIESAYRRWEELAARED
ncbi:MAG: ATP-binding cassette domain-containing protein [Gammaproteobacteria bacterium]|jgi:ATP-binding cassette subfamily F protein uup|nr:ATP-binding cassette domain-containing protein [Gammaproteobacteria bacterium]